MSDQDSISPCNINTISKRKVMRMRKNINYHKKCVADSKGNYTWDLRSERVNPITFYVILIRYPLSLSQLLNNRNCFGNTNNSFNGMVMKINKKSISSLNKKTAMGCKWELILEEKEAPLLICDQNLNNCCQGLTELSKAPLSVHADLAL